MRTHLGECRFHNCTHLHEPGCAIKTALDQGLISAQRYRIYEQLMAELSAPPHW
jgi:ribosome biogenesis GTPase